MTTRYKFQNVKLRRLANCMRKGCTKLLRTYIGGEMVVLGVAAFDWNQ